VPTIIKVFVVVLTLLVFAIALVALIGSRLPKQHIATRSILVHKTPAEVYAVVHDFESAPKWRTDLHSVEVITTADGKIRFKETGKDGEVNFELTEDVPGQRMVTRIVDTDLGYSGAWTYTFTVEGNSTRLSITENGEVSNVIFRFLSKHVFGHTATIDEYLTALAKHLGETAKPE
jgi:uncharacterized membrane protein